MGAVERRVAGLDDAGRVGGPAQVEHGQRQAGVAGVAAAALDATHRGNINVAGHFAHLIEVAHLQRHKGPGRSTAHYYPARAHAVNVAGGRILPEKAHGGAQILHAAQRRFAHGRGVEAGKAQPVVDASRDVTQPGKPRAHIYHVLLAARAGEKPALVGEDDDRPLGYHVAGGLINVHQQRLRSAESRDGRAVSHARSHRRAGELGLVKPPAGGVDRGLGQGRPADAQHQQQPKKE